MKIPDRMIGYFYMQKYLILKKTPTKKEPIIGSRYFVEGIS